MAFNSLSRDHLPREYVIALDQLVKDFQLPLSGSPKNAVSGAIEQLDILSTPSLGITQRLLNSLAALDRFQLPLSGSQQSLQCSHINACETLL